MQLDAMAVYKQQRQPASDFNLDTVEKPQENGKVTYDQTTDTYHVACGRFTSSSYALYNLQVMRLEEVIGIQRRLDAIITEKRKKDPNYNVTVLHRDGSMPSCVLI